MATAVDSRHLPPVICLMGPTAAGKTELAIALRDHFPCDLISVDSAMVYRSMDIGTGKPDTATQARAPHRLIDIRDPADAYSVADFRVDVCREIDSVHSAGRLPLLVGGTMLYFKALQDGLAEMPAADPDVRAGIEREAADQGWPALHQQLARIDPEAAARLHPNHSQRIARALEIHRLTGSTLTALHHRQPVAAPRYHYVQLAMAPTERAVLHWRIEQRFQHMLNAGLVDEVRALHARPDLHAGLASMRAVGYRQVWDYLEDRCDYTAMHAAGIAATRQLAKRQLTWLRNWPDLRWIFTDASGQRAATESTALSRQHTPLQIVSEYLQVAGVLR